MDLENGRKRILVLAAIMNLIVLTIGGTYAFFSYSKSGVTENTISAGSITFHYEEIDKIGHGIGITDALPISDTEGKAQENAFNFRITSKTASNIEVPYTITLRQKEGTDNIGEIIKVYLAKTSSYDAAVNTETEVVTSLYTNLDDVTKNGYQEKVLYTDTVPADSSNYNQTYRLKLWMDENTNLSGNEVTKYYCSNVEVEYNSTEYDNCDPSDLTTRVEMEYPYEDKEFSVMVNVYAEGEIPLAAGLYDSNNNLIMDYNTFASTYNFDVEEDEVTLYLSEPGTNQWIAVTYATEKMEPIEYEDIPDSSPVKIFANQELSEVTKLVFPDNVTRIGDGKFAYAINVSEIVLPKNLEEIGVASFMFSGIENLTIPNTVTSAGANAFAYCTNLKTLTFEKNSRLTKITDTMFGWTTSLEEVTIPSSVTTLEEYAFNASGIKKLTFEEGSQIKDIADYAFYELSTLEELTLPEGIETIGTCAFDGTGIKTLTIPASLKSTGHAAFAGCTELETVIFEEGSQFETLGSATFYLDNKLSSINLPPTLKTIEHGVFQKCLSLTDLTIPASVTSIGPDSFFIDKMLQRVYFENPNGWTYNNRVMSSTDLQNPQTAASLLNNNNIQYDWLRSDN